MPSDHSVNVGDQGQAERWAPVPGWPAYEVSDWGRVRSLWKRHGTRESLVMLPDGEPKLLKICRGDKRAHVTLGDGKGRQRTFGVAMLVLMAFVRMPEPGECALHTNDPDPSNCRLENLRWGTCPDNHDDAVRHCGKHFNAKLTPQQANEIRRRIAAGERQDHLAAEFGVTPSLIGHIKKNRIHRRSHLYSEKGS